MYSWDAVNIRKRDEKETTRLTVLYKQFVPVLSLDQSFRKKSLVKKPRK
jgi:hypothetical protein